LRFRFLLSTSILFLALFFGAANAHAEDLIGVSVTPINESALDDQANNEVLFVYDPSAIEDAAPILISKHDLELISEKMRTDDYRSLLNNRVVIPMATENAEDFAKLDDLSETELRIFLSRKASYLEKIAKTLIVFRLEPSAVNKVVSLLNKQMFKHAKIVARKHAKAIALGIGVSAGAGFSDWLTAQLRKSPLLKDLPKNTGFYFQLSLGLCIINTEKDGKSKLSFQPVFEFRRAEKILAPFAGVGVGGGFGVSLEAPNPDDVQVAKFYKLSSLNITSSDTTLGMSYGTGIGIGFMKFAAIEGTATAFRADRDGFKRLISFLRESFTPLFTPALINKCSAIFVKPELNWAH
jgi:hypothetical protein